MISHTHKGIYNRFFVYQKYLPTIIASEKQRNLERFRENVEHELRGGDFFSIIYISFFDSRILRIA